MKTVHKNLLALTMLLTPLAAGAQGFFENPPAQATVSGLGVISGWHCSAGEMEFFIDDISVGTAAVGSKRQDAINACGRAEVGYGLLYNFNKLVPGKHIINVFADGLHIERREFKSVQSGGTPFLTGASKTVEIPGFPAIGETAVLAWSQATQNFVVTDIRDTSKDAGDGQPLTPKRMKLNSYNEITNRPFVNHYKVELQKDERVFIDVELFFPEVETAILELCAEAAKDTETLGPATIMVANEDSIFVEQTCNTQMLFTAKASGLYVFRFDYGRNGQGNFFPVRF